jgi:hypothetical protein
MIKMTKLNITTALDIVQADDVELERKIEATTYAAAYFSYKEEESAEARAAKFAPCNPFILQAARTWAERVEAFKPKKNKVAAKIALAMVHFSLSVREYKLLKKAQFFTHMKSLGQPENAEVLEKLLADSKRGYSSVSSLYRTMTSAKSAANGKKGAQDKTSASENEASENEASENEASADTLDNQLKSLFAWAAKQHPRITLPELKREFDARHAEAVAKLEALQAEAAKKKVA